eukprot:Skav218097  [mRNA]  locus=scaffold1454:82189:84299:+ [translate_table: standard]
MARQRVGQSRRCKLSLAIVTVVLCFLHLPINGSQTLAAPGGREATRASLEKLMVRELRTKLHEQGLQVSGQKADLVERLLEHMAMEKKRVRSGKRKIPEALKLADRATDVFIPLDETVPSRRIPQAEEPAIFDTDVFIPLDKTIGELEAKLQEERVVFLRAGVACGKSTLAQHLCSVQPSKYLQVYHPAPGNATYAECWGMQFKEALLKVASTADVADRNLQIAFERLFKNEQVYLSEDAVHFFLHLCGGHRGILMRAMEWVQINQKGAAKPWTITQAYGEVKLAWADGDWGCPDSFLGKLATVRAIRVKGNYADLGNIPQKFLEILCGGATSNLESEDRRNLTIHGFLLPVPAKGRTEEFVRYDWSAQGASYGVSSHLLASYYRYVLEKERQLEVDVNRTASSCTDLLLRALPYLDFATIVGGVIPRNKSVQAAFSAQGLPSEVHYTGAIIQLLQCLGFGATSVETGSQGKVDIYCKMQDGSTFAIEAVMAACSRAVIKEHRSRFDRLPNYKDAKHKCLLIIGRQDSQLRKLVQGTLGGTEIVGLAANSAHTGYRVYIKRRGGEALDFYIPCDGVARSFSFMDEKVSPAQKFKNIRGRILFKPTLVCALKDVGNVLGVIGFYCK